MHEKKNLTIEETFALALKNHQNKNYQVAENLYKQILKVNPNHFESIFYLGSLLIEIRNFDQAKSLLQKAITIQPNYAVAYVNLGIALEELGQSQQAMNHFQKAIEIQPNFAVAHFNLGYAFNKLNELHKAINHYKKTIQIDPNYVLAHNNLGITFKELGKPLEALACYKNAVLIDPNFTLAVNNMSILLKEIRLTNLTQANSSSLRELILLLYKRNDINHTDIFRNATTFLFIEKNKNQISKIVNSDSLLLKNQIIQNLLKEELFLLMLQKSLVLDQFIEQMLTKLRYEILFSLVDADQNILEEDLDFIISLAEQCFLNEYVYVQSKKEINHVKKLINEISNKKEINELKIAILGCYIPLLSNENIANILSDYKSKNILFNDLINMQIKEPLKEKKLVNSIKSLGKISDAVSNKVRGQYEEYPYPRWRYTYSNSPKEFSTFINNQIKPNKIKVNHKFYNPNVLIAGCGTGNHICRAANYLNANILAVDLSLASLSYAKRKVEELGLKSIEFLHADILQLNNLNKKFDVIESVGVLHHMDDPIKGLNTLRGLLETHGLLLIGLYSEKARQEVIRAKEFAIKNKFENSFAGIRSFREAIFKEKTDLLLQKVSRGRDFYSTSSIKDLIFHVQEHRFTLPQIFKILENLNLEFLGFCDSEIKNQYSKLFPNDKKNISFNNWIQFEILEPLAFSGMYKFWVRKKSQQ